ncbi:hypothetical protein [Lunatibacter salilacus]|uniref:hypothetical protein n=1 Tax=Lunatibacter salilacus TaxID=2483804 RepID=UPI001F221327|nr:hypothetical protein [Lunatibacter salilacus]
MVRISPTYSEILVSSLPAEEVMKKALRVTREMNYLDPISFESHEKHLFNGTVHNDTFHLSLKTENADSFIPLIRGKVETTRKGCILFLHYSFFPSTVFFLGFWIVATFFMMLFFLTLQLDLKLAALCLVAGMGNYWFSSMHFMRKVKQSQKALHHMLDLQPNDPR